MFDPNSAFNDLGASYRPADHYWKRASGPIFSSRRIAYVTAADKDYKAWLARGNDPTPFPVDEEGVESVAELQRALDLHSLHATLESYAGALRYAQEVSGAPVTLGGVALVVSTARTMAPALRSTVMDIEFGIRADGDVLKVFADGVSRFMSNADAKAAALAGIAHIQAAFNLEGRVAAEIRSGALATKADVEAAFGLDPAEPEPAPAETAAAA